ncbi:putative mitochondrial protein [Tanacetum coccineum]
MAPTTRITAIGNNDDGFNERLRQFIRLNGENVSWNVYKSVILQRFGTVYDDPISKIMKVKYQTNAKDYQDAFDTLLSRVDISEENVVSFYLGRLPAEIEIGLYSLVMLADEEEEYFKVEEGDEVMHVQEELPKISLNALNGVAKRIGYPLKDTCHLAVTVGGGKQLINTKEYAIEVMVRELLEALVIKTSNSPFASPIVMVKKKDNTWRMCVDYRMLNKNTITDKFTIPIIKELIDELHGAAVFLFMPFGLTNAPSTFQALMTEVFKSFLRKFTLVFFDDILVRFIKGFASLSITLTQLLKNNAFKWTLEAQLSFEALKKAIMEALVLELPDFNEPLVIKTDASGVELGAMIQQKAILLHT